MMCRLLLPFLIASTMSACTTEVVTWEEPPQGRDEEDDDPFRTEDDAPGLGDVVGIPKSKMPPPGSCRLWYPERGAGQQPPSGNCDALRNSVPDGAWLLYRPSDEPRVYRIG